MFATARFPHDTAVIAAASLVALLPFTAPANADVSVSSSVGTLVAETVVTGLANPWAVAVLPDGALLVTERPGALRIVEGGRVGPEIKGVPDVFARGQGGLLDVVPAPDFATSGTIYMTYAKPASGGRASTAVMRATLQREGPRQGRLAEVQDILVTAPAGGGGRHFGSRIVIAPDGTLFVTTGDRGDADRAQRMEDHAGAVLRINPDGSVPADNPYASGGALPHIFSKGHRNPQGAALDAETGTLFTVEHGARGGDEINIPQAGRNYGWPVITYGRDYSGVSIGEGTEKAGMEQPLLYWDPSIAPSGLVVYRGAMFPEWNGDLLVGALAGQMLVRVDRDGNALTEAERLFEGELGRIRDVRVDPADGSLLLAIDDDPGSIIRVRRTQ